MLATQYQFEAEAIKGMDEAAAWHTVGIVCNLGHRESQGVGTGVAVKFCNRQFILTAAHVIHGTKLKDLWFLFRPPGSLVRAEYSELPSRLREVAITPRRKLPLKKAFIYRRSDIALLEVADQNVEEEYTVRFFEVTPNAATPPPGTVILSKGYPCGLAQPMGDQDRMLLPAANNVPMADIVPNGLKDFDPRKSFLAPFALAQFGMGAHGFSGAAGWFHNLAPLVWHPNLGFAGMVTHYYSESEMLVYVRVQEIVRCLNRACKQNR